MKLIDIEKLEYEPFILENGETVDYISAENIRKAPRIDPVNHGEWVKSMIVYDRIYVRHNCSNCGVLGWIDIFDALEWEAYRKDHYDPKLSKYCSDCGYKMDRREIHEAYDTYKREWCESRGYILEVVEEKGGINGECYACFDEWYDNEYRELRGE